MQSVAWCCRAFSPSTSARSLSFLQPLSALRQNVYRQARGLPNQRSILRLYPCLASEEDTKAATKSAETFVKFKEAVERSSESVSEDTLESFLKLAAVLNDELDNADLMLEIAPTEMPQWQRSILEVNNEFSIWLKDVTARMKFMLDNKIQMPYSQFVKEVVGMQPPRLQSVFGAAIVFGNALAPVPAVLLLVWICKFFDVDGLQEFRTPFPGWGLSWMLWTAPYALVMYAMWHLRSLSRWKPLKGFKSVAMHMDFYQELIQQPARHGDWCLAAKALSQSWTTAVVFQGVVFGFLQGLLSAPRTSSEGYSFGGIASTMPLPPLLTFPVELLLLCTVYGLLNLAVDRSILISSDEVIEFPAGVPLLEMDPRCGAKTLEDFEILNDDQITQQRAWLTFGYHFLTLGYLTLEAVALRSLYTSMATLVIGRYIMFKGMQRNDDS